jgi:dihydropteridine reductase
MTGGSLYGLVFGGCGALGKAVVRRLNHEGFKVISIDLLNNNDAHRNIQIRPSWTLHDQSVAINDGLRDILSKHKVSNVFCAAGGWKGGSIRDTDFVQVFHDNHTVNLEPAILATHFGLKYMAKNGLLVLTGAAAALSPTPDMLAYGMAKSSCHFMVQSIAQDQALIQDRIAAVAILPQVIDTISNRFAMPQADFSTWTKVFIVVLDFVSILGVKLLLYYQPEDIAAHYLKWIQG